VKPNDATQEMIPPRERLPGYARTGGFLERGERFLQASISLCNLRPDEWVLDVGCGFGRFAVPLTQYLDARGSYDGVDVDRDAVEWCAGAITSRYPRFRFHHADAYNGQYNREGIRSAADYEFPLGDGVVDLVFANSLFTHLLQRDTEAYVREIARVLRPGGRSFLTFFLLDDEASALVAAGKAVRPFAGERPPYSFRRQIGPLRVENPDRPEEAVAYDEPYVRELFESAGLTVAIHHGSWSGRPEQHGELSGRFGLGRSFDIVVAGQSEGR
jgi:SAM-dependent methyltransferase